MLHENARILAPEFKLEFEAILALHDRMLSSYSGHMIGCVLGANSTIFRRELYRHLGLRCDALLIGSRSGTNALNEFLVLALGQETLT